MPYAARYEWGVRAASRMRRLTLEATHRHVRLEFQGPVYIGPGFNLRLLDRGAFVVGPDVEFRRGNGFEISGQGYIEVGARSQFTANTLVQCSTSIIFEDDVVLSQNVLVADGNHRFRDWQTKFLEQGYDYRPLRFGAGCAVLAKCTVMADIGTGAVVGANSVVTRPVPAYCLAVGAPAKVVEYFGPPELRPPGLEV